MSDSHQPNQWAPNNSQYQMPPPTAQSKKKGGCLKIAGIGIVALLAMGGLAQCVGGGSSSSSSSATYAPTTQATQTQEAAAERTTEAPAPTTEAPAPAPAEPAMEVTAQQMISDLEGNALKAKRTYEGKVVTVTGYVGNIDASGKYFSVDPEEDAIIFTGVQAYVDEPLRDQLADMSKNDPVTVTGKVTAVGEVMGYSIDVDTMS